MTYHCQWPHTPGKGHRTEDAPHSCALRPEGALRSQTDDLEATGACVGAEFASAVAAADGGALGNACWLTGAPSATGLGNAAPAAGEP